MNKILTKKQIEQAKFPSRLEVMREKNKRHALSKKQQQDLYMLETGFIGEQAVIKQIEEFGQNHWSIISNLWLYEYGMFEIDLFLITSTDKYTFEIKNYNKNFEYKNSQCFYDGKLISQNPIHQAQKVKINFQNILKNSGLNLNTKGALIFTGQHCDVKIHNPVENLEVLTLNQLRQFIWRIAEEEKEQLNNSAQRIDVNQVLAVIEKHEIEQQFPPQVLTEAEKIKMKRGVMCSRCGSFNVNTSHSYIVCDCGMHEPREMAIVRTICEYGVLNFDKDLTSKELTEFFDGDYVRSTIITYLNKYFKKIGSKRGTKYDNKRLQFESVMKQFPFNRYRYLKF